METIETGMKPCPFCGGNAELHERYHSIDETVHKKSEIPKDAKFLYKKITSKSCIYVYKQKIFIPRCMDSSCVGRTTKIFFDKQLAVNAWNGRKEGDQE